MNIRNKSVIVNIIGNKKLGLLELIIHLTQFLNCNIINSHAVILDNTFSGAFKIIGSWHQIEKLRINLDNEKQQLDFYCSIIVEENVSKITQDSNGKEMLQVKEDVQYIPYSLQINTPDNTGLLNKIINFFTQRSILIDKLSSNTISTVDVADMAQINIKLNVPNNTHLPELRDSFDLMCYQENIDAILLQSYNQENLLV